MSGFVVIRREALDHHIIGEPTRFYAWCWLISTACWKPTRFDIRGKTIILERGQLCASRSQMAEAWNWSGSAVERFLTRLQTEQMIERLTGQGRSVITICNYDKYQDKPKRAGQPTEQQSGQQSDSNRTAKEQGNNYSISNDMGGTPPTAAELTKAIWDTGRSILKAGGYGSRQAGSIIGKWRKTYSDSEVLTVLARCEAIQPSEPVEWITKALQTERGQTTGNHHGSKGSGTAGAAQRALAIVEGRGH